MELFLLLAISVSIVALLTVRWPVSVMLGLYAFLLPFDSVLSAGDVGQIHLHFTWFVGAAACALLLLIGLFKRGFLRPPRTALLLFLFLLWAVMSSAWAINPRDALFRSPIIALLFLLYLLAASSDVQDGELSAVSSMAVMGGCAAAALTLYQFVQGTNWSPDALEHLDPIDGMEFARRASLVLLGKVTNPNDLAASLILPLSLAVGLWLSARSSLIQLFLMGIMGLIGSAILLTMSRGAWVAMVMVFLVFVWRTRADWRLFAPFVAIGGIIAAMPDVFLARFEDAAADRGAGRLDIWNAGLQVFRAHSIWGVGLDNFPVASDKYKYLAIHYWGPVAKSPHNIYLGTAAELGAIGLVLLLGFIGSHFLTSSAAIRYEPEGPVRLRLISYEAGCWGLLTAGCFTHLIWEQYFWFAWILLMLSAQMNYDLRRHREHTFFSHARPIPA